MIENGDIPAFRYWQWLGREFDKVAGTTSDVRTEDDWHRLSPEVQSSFRAAAASTSAVLRAVRDMVSRTSIGGGSEKWKFGRETMRNDVTVRLSDLEDEIIGLIDWTVP